MRKYNSYGAKFRIRSLLNWKRQASTSHPREVLGVLSAKRTLILKELSLQGGDVV